MDRSRISGQDTGTLMFSLCEMRSVLQKQVYRKNNISKVTKYHDVGCHILGTVIVSIGVFLLLKVQIQLVNFVILRGFFTSK